MLLETLKFINSNEKVVEVPYTGFHERVYGKSKAGVKQLRTKPNPKRGTGAVAIDDFDRTGA